MTLTLYKSRTFFERQDLVTGSLSMALYKSKTSCELSALLTGSLTLTLYKSITYCEEPCLLMGSMTSGCNCHDIACTVNCSWYSWGPAVDKTMEKVSLEFMV